MGNCVEKEIQCESSKYSRAKGINGLPRTTLLSRLEAVESTVFIHRSMILRNYLNVKKEAAKLVDEHQIVLGIPAFQRLKLYEAIMKLTEKQMEALKEAINNAELNQNKKECRKTLASTYTLIQDVGELIKLEDVLQGEDGPFKSKEGFEILIEQYTTKEEAKEVKEDLMSVSISTMDSLPTSPSLSGDNERKIETINNLSPAIIVPCKVGV